MSRTLSPTLRDHVSQGQSALLVPPEVPVPGPAGSAAAWEPGTLQLGCDRSLRTKASDLSPTQPGPHHNVCQTKTLGYIQSGDGIFVLVFVVSIDTKNELS